MVPVRTLAAEWNVDPSTARKYVLACGFQPQKLRDPSRRGQKILCLTEEEAQKARARHTKESL